MGEAGDRARQVYAANRARALGRDLAPTVAGCGRRAVGTLCGCGAGCDRDHRPRRMDHRWLGHAAEPDGSRGDRSTVASAHVKFTCKQHLVCETCLRKRGRKLAAKMAVGLAAALEAERAAWRAGGCRRGGKPQIVLMTLTIGHSGDVAKDRAELAAGWRAFYKSLHRRGWRRPYCGAWEATSGRDGLGHVHMHVAIVWPFVPWHVVSRLWRAACPRSATIDLAARRKDGRPTTGQSAARYIGKYVSKGTDFGAMGEVLAADIVAASYNQRTVLTSRKFWRPWVRPHCARCGVVPWVDGQPFPAMTDAERECNRAEQRERDLALLRDAWRENEPTPWMAHESPTRRAQLFNEAMRRRLLIETEPQLSFPAIKRADHT